MITNAGTILKEGLEGKEVALRGWVHRHRVSGNMVFIDRYGTPPGSSRSP